MQAKRNALVFAGHNRKAMSKVMCARSNAEFLSDSSA